MFAFSTREQPNTITKNNRDHRDRDILDQTSSKKLTEYLASVNVYPLLIGESIRQFQRRARIELLGVVRFRRTMRHHDHALANAEIERIRKELEKEAHKDDGEEK